MTDISVGVAMVMASMTGFPGRKLTSSWRLFSLLRIALTGIPRRRDSLTCPRQWGHGNLRVQLPLDPYWTLVPPRRGCQYKAADHFPQSVQDGGAIRRACINVLMKSRYTANLSLISLNRWLFTQILFALQPFDYLRLTGRHALVSIDSLSSSEFYFHI